MEGIFDEGSKFLRNLFGRLSDFLSPNGKLILIYSNISFLLGLQEEGIIENLCIKNGFKITYKEEAIAQDLQVCALMSFINPIRNEKQ